MLNSKETIEAVKFVAALYKEAMTSEVLSWDDFQQQPLSCFGHRLDDRQPDLGLSDIPEEQPKGADDTFLMKPPKGPVRQIMGGAAEYYGIWKFAKNKEAAIEFLKYYADHWPEAFKASEGYNNPCFANLVPKPMPILSNDPTSTPNDKLAILQGSDEWSAAPGYPGRRGPPSTRSTTTSSSAT